MIAGRGAVKGLDARLARVRMRLSQWQLAEKLGVHRARLSEMERDQRPIPDEVAVRIRELEAATVGAADA